MALTTLLLLFRVPDHLLSTLSFQVALKWTFVIRSMNLCRQVISRSLALAHLILSHLPHFPFPPCLSGWSLISRYVLLAIGAEQHPSYSPMPSHYSSLGTPRLTLVPEPIVRVWTKVEYAFPNQDCHVYLCILVKMVRSPLRWVWCTMLLLIPNYMFCLSSVPWYPLSDLYRPAVYFLSPSRYIRQRCRGGCGCCLRQICRISQTW